MSETHWRPARFYIAQAGTSPFRVYGYVLRGLGLHNHGWATPRTKTRWTLTHIGCGAVVMKITGDVRTVFPIAAEVAECSDWTLFDLPEGWRQTDPMLPEKIRAICDAHPEVTPNSAKSKHYIKIEDARAVIEMRESAHD